MEANDVGVPERGRDLNLSLDVDLVQVISDALLADRLDRHLREKHKVELSIHYSDIGGVGSEGEQSVGKVGPALQVSVSGL
ncbi:hypothetical protein INR49_009028 [Caranx melampygus]|nr:hypothetical protein INR49_009028 [Caranx melampygus]